jgi:outer membrane protein
MKGKKEICVSLACAIACILCFVLVTGLAGAGEGGGTISLDACIEKAVERNLALIQSSLAEEATGLQASIALKEMFPTLSTNYSYTGRRDVSTVSAGGLYFPVSSHDNYAWDVTLTQPIFHGGALWNRYKIAQLDLDVSQLQVEQVKNDLVRQVKEAYYSILKTEMIKEESDAAVKRLEAHLTDAKGFYEVGLIAKNDLLQSEVEAAQARQALISASHDVEIAKARLNLLLRQDLDTPLEPEDVLAFTPYREGLDDLLATAQRLRPEIKAGTLTVEKARKEIDVARGGYWPNLDFNAVYSKAGTDPQMSENPFGDRDMANIMLTASWELWAWGKTRDTVGVAGYGVSKAEAALYEVRDAVAFDIKQAWLRLREAAENIEVARTSLAQAEENYRLNTERYKERLATSTDVLDAQSLLTSARTGYFNAMADHLIAKAVLDYAAGK